MEKTIVLEKRHCPYMSKKQLAEELGYGETSIYKEPEADTVGMRSQEPDITILR